MKNFSFIAVLLMLGSASVAQINCPPNLPLTLNGNTEYCIGTPGAELSVAQNYDGYEWLPSSETGQNVLLTAGNYQLVVTHYTGCTDTLAFEVQQVSNPPQPTVTSSSATEFCEGGSVVLSGPAGYPYYLWNSGSISQNITVYESGTFVLSIIDWLGCSSSSNSIQVIVNPLPTAAFSPDLELYDIEFNNLSLEATSYEWNFGDGSISTDFEPAYTYTTDGTLDMYLVASNDCGSDTAFLTLESVDVEESEMLNNLSVYPNPSDGQFQVQFSTEASDLIAISVYDMLGQRISVLSTTIGSGSVSIPIDLSGLNHGLYMVEVKTAQSSATRLVQVSKP